MGCVYLFENKLNGKKYVGKTKHDLRRRDHKREVAAGGQRLFLRALRKYGFDAFITSTIFESEREEALLEAEKIAIADLNTKHPYGYNLTDGGDGAAGYVFTEEQRQKVSRGLEGKKKTDSHVSAMREAWKLRKRRGKGCGKPHSEATRMKIREKSLGRKHTEATKQKISKAKKAPSVETRKRLSVAATKTWSNKETREKRIQAAKDKIVSDETRQKLREIVLDRIKNGAKLFGRV